MADGEYVEGVLGGVYNPEFRKVDDGRRLLYKFVDHVGRDRADGVFGEPLGAGAGSLKHAGAAVKTCHYGLPLVATMHRVIPDTSESELNRLGVILAPGALARWSPSVRLAGRPAGHPRAGRGSRGA